MARSGSDPPDHDDRGGLYEDGAGKGCFAESSAMKIFIESGVEIVDGLVYTNIHIYICTNSGELQHTISQKCTGACAVPRVCECQTSAHITICKGIWQLILI